MLGFRLPVTSDSVAVFGVKLFNDAIGNTVKCNRKSEIQHGDSRNASTGISAYTRESNEIPTAIPMFPRSDNMAKLSRTLHVQRKDDYESRDGGH